MNLLRRPLFLIALAYIAGILCAAYAGLYPFTGLGIAGGIFLLGIALPSKVIGRPILGVLVLVFAVGFVRTAFFRQIPSGDISEYAEGQVVEITGRIASDPEISDRSRFIMEAKAINGQRAHGNVAVTLRLLEDTSDLPTYGQTIRITGRLRKPMPVTNPGAFDYGEYLARKRVYCSMYSGLSDAEEIEAAPWSLAWAAAKFKSALTSKASVLFPPKRNERPIQARLLLGILLGGYSSLPLDVQGAFMRSGTMHILAASGYNCGVIIGIFGYLFRRLTAHRTAMHILLIALLWGYTLVAGAGPSIVRAAIMVTVFLIAYLLWRANDLINVVLFSAMIILAANPLSLFDIGFQLSFAAVLSLILIMPRVDTLITPRFWRKRMTPRSRGLHIIVFAVLMSIAGMIGTGPIIAYYFNYVSTTSFLANALVALLVVALTAGGIIALALGYIWMPLGYIAALPCKVMLAGMIWVVTKLGGHPLSALYIHSPPPIVIILYYLVLLGALECFHRRCPLIQRTAGLS